VVVDFSKPATPVGVPVESKMSVLSGVTGTAKLARFSALKISARNCTLKLSEILFTTLFLNTERSRFEVPGPIRMLRPPLPRRLKHASGERLVPAIGPPSVGGAGSQLFDQKVGSGAVGTAKHWVLM